MEEWGRSNLLFSGGNGDLLMLQKQTQTKQSGKRDLAWLGGLMTLGGLALSHKALFKRLGWPYPAWLSAMNELLDVAFGTSLLYPVGHHVRGAITSQKKNFSGKESASTAERKRTQETL